jgi:phosphate/sulfate permease
LLPWWGTLLFVIAVGVITMVIVLICKPCIIHYAYRKAGLDHDLELPLGMKNPCGKPKPSVTPNSEPQGVELQEIHISEEERRDVEEHPQQYDVEIDIDLKKEDSKNEIKIELSKEETKNEPAIDDDIIEIHLSKSDSELPVQPVNADSQTAESGSVDDPSSVPFEARTEELFSIGQVLMAIVGSFAHGANDVANAIGPFAVIISVYQTQSVDQSSDIPYGVLLMGGAGIVLGLATWGYRVMKTIGENLTKVTPSRGFNIELGSALTVMAGSRLGVPLSTTHCKVRIPISIKPPHTSLVNHKMKFRLVQL